jgi:hypothetical protein
MHKDQVNASRCTYQIVVVKQEAAVCRSVVLALLEAS